MESDTVKRLVIKNRFRITQKHLIMSYSNSKYGNLTDIELVAKYKATDDMVFIGELYKRYSHLVLGMCINYFKDKEVAKDVVVEIFEKLFVELKKREVESFKAWLTFVVRNHCISELRKLQTQLNRDMTYYNEHKNQIVEDINEGLIAEGSKLEAMEHAMKFLNPFQKKCIELFYLNNMSYAQIVDKTGYSVNEVKSYIQNGKRNLKMLITDSK